MHSFLSLILTKRFSSYEVVPILLFGTIWEIYGFIVAAAVYVVFKYSYKKIAKWAVDQGINLHAKEEII